jgi:type I restriction enzyme S subunit
MTMISNMPCYAEMKDSGVEWLGEIPVGWDISRMKNVILSAQNGFWGEEPKGNQNDVFCARVADFDRTNLIVTDELSTIRNIPAEQRESRKVSKGDLLFEKSGGGDQTLVGALVQYVGDAPIICSNFVAVVRCKKGINSRWLCYINSYLYSVSVNLRAIKQTTGIQNIDSDAYFSELIPVPTTSEQIAIASFLDQKADKIDQAITLKQKQIELFKERKQLVIQHAVTKGLNPHAPMRDSGVEWIGEIPEHWEVFKLSHIARIDSGSTPDRARANYWNGDIPWVKTGEVNYTDILESEEYITKAGLKNSSTKLAPSGTLLMAMYGQGITRGRVALLGIPATYNQACCGITFKSNFINRFTLNFFIAAYPYIRESGNETSQMNLSTGYISTLKIVCPSLDEQKNIIAHIETQSAKIDKAIDIQQQQINKLKEYKATLINSAVTGKIKVA